MIKINESPLPSHIAIIMDGNGRWSSQRNLPTILGHKEGANSLKKIARHAGQLGIQYLTVFAFSTENWKRPIQWVHELMSLLRYYLQNEIKDMVANNVRLSVIGDKSQFDQDIQDLIEKCEEQTKDNTGLNLIIALNYGGRKDIVQACVSLCQDALSQKITPEEITDSVFSSKLYTKDIPDPDLLIRTSGEYRISNYLLWQLAYAEFVFTPKLWPDFNEEDMDEAIKQFRTRNRRFGAIIADSKNDY